MLSPASTGTGEVQNWGLLQVGANGTRLWFDVEDASVVPDGDAMRERPTVVL